MIKQTYRDFVDNMIEIEPDREVEFPLDLLNPNFLSNEKKFNSCYLLFSGIDYLQKVLCGDCIGFPSCYSFNTTGIEEPEEKLIEFMDKKLRKLYKLYLDLDVNVQPLVVVKTKNKFTSLYFGCIEEDEKWTRRRFEK